MHTILFRAHPDRFDLFENEIQQFLLKVRDELSADATPPPPSPPRHRSRPPTLVSRRGPP